MEPKEVENQLNKLEARVQELEKDRAGLTSAIAVLAELVRRHDHECLGSKPEKSCPGTFSMAVESDWTPKPLERVTASFGSDVVRIDFRYGDDDNHRRNP